MFFAKKPVTVPEDIAGIRVRPSTRARRMALRVDTKTGDVVLVWPKRGSEKNARRFIEQHRDWIEQQRRQIPQLQTFVPGGQISVAGQDLKLEHRPGRGLSRIENGALIVHGGPAHFSRRVRDFLRKEAEGYLRQLSDEKARRLDLKPAAIRVVDPKTRWGSCSSDGRLMYSWRLILAPLPVMDYVVAHEVAHRVHMNHGRKFWALCASLTENAAVSRRWLKTDGRQLMMWR